MTPRLEPTEMALRRLLALLTAVLATAWVVFYGVDPVPHLEQDGAARAFFPAVSVLLVLLPWVSVALLWWRLREFQGENGNPDLPPSARALAAGAGSDAAGQVHAAGDGSRLDVRGTHRYENLAFTPLVLEALLAAAVPVLAAQEFSAWAPTTAAADRAGLIATFAIITGFLAIIAALPVQLCVTYIVAVHVLRGALVLTEPWPSPSLAAFSVLQSLVVCLLVMGRGLFLRQIAASVDRALDRAARTAAHAAGRAAAAVEAARIDGLVHDHILAALLIASRADHAEDAPMVRRSAAGALAALSEIVAPLDDTTDTDPDTPTTTPITDFATTLITHIHNLDPTITTTGRGHLTPHHTLPTTVATTLTAATLEAVRNSLRHADGGTGHPVRRTVTLATTDTTDTTDTTTTITITDDGTGFDPTTAPTGRYGLTGSILGRLNTLDGGHAHLDTTPGHGTTITLTYTPPPSTHTENTSLQARDDAVPTGPFAEFRRTDTRSPAMVMGRRLVADAGEDVSGALPIAATSGIALATAASAWFSSETLSDPVTNGIMAGLGVVACLVMSVFMFRDASAAAPRSFVIPIAPAAAISLLLLIPGYTGGPNVLASFWIITSIYLVILYLAIEGYPVLALSCAALSSIVLAVWGVVADWPGGWLHGGWPLFFLASAMVSSYQIASIRSMEHAAVLSLGLRSRIDAEARRAAAGNARRLNARRVDHLARPLLERLAAGERTLPTVRTEAQLIEARLRDDLRARCFRTTDVTRAAHDARARGVHVELLDDGGLAGAPAELRERVITAAVTALDAAQDGAVIIRVAPPGRDIVATVVTRPHAGAAGRLEIPAGGTPEAAAPTGVLAPGATDTAGRLRGPGDGPVDDALPEATPGAADPDPAVTR